MSIPGAASPLFIGAAAGAAAAYQIDRSLRFSEGDQAYLNRTPSSAGNRKTYTLSFWVKKSKIGDEMFIFAAKSGGGRDGFRFEPGNTFRVFFDSANDGDLVTTQVFRDPSAWYHFVIAVDTTQSTAANRVKIYVNGAQIEDFSTETYPVQNYTGEVNNTDLHRIGADTTNLSNTLEGYLTEIHFVDGQALAPTDFGEYDDNNVWQPKEYSGTYGTNGFHLDFSDNSSNAALGTDSSGNGNTWTVNNLTAEDAKTLDGIVLDGSGDYLSFANDSDFDLGQSSEAFTIEAWVKADNASQTGAIFTRGGGASGWNSTDGHNYLLMTYNGSIYFQWWEGSTDRSINGSTLDQGKWTHVAAVYDGTDVKLYKNGTQIASYSNASFGLVTTRNITSIGRHPDDTGDWDGNISSVRVVKGTAVYTQAFAPSIDLTNVTNTIVLCCKSSSSATASVVTPSTITSNGNVAAGTFHDGTSANDSLIDTPTNYEAGSGNNGGNYATLNPLDRKSTVSLSNGNLDATTSTTGWAGVKGTMGVSSGKYYFEATANGSAANKVFFGICASSVKPDTSGYLQDDTTERAKGMLIFCDNGQYQLDGNSRVSYSSSMADGDVIAVAYDLDGNTVQFYKNGSALGSIDISSSPLANTTVVPLYIHYNTNTTYHLNFGQRPFAYTIPTGFKSLCTTNLPDPTIADGSTGFDTKLWQGTGVAKSITGYNFSPDLVWGKARSATNTHWLMDTVRGAGKRLVSADTRAEDTPSGVLTSFNSDGFSIGTNTESNNSDGTTYVGWTWDGGSSTASNSDGSITTNVRANASAGFSIIGYTGNATVGATLGHGLNSAPEWLVFKNRDDVLNWYVYHKAAGHTKYFTLDRTHGATTHGFLNNTAPTNSVITLNNTAEVNATGQDIICYAWTSVSGYSSFGSYLGNGSSDGPFVFTGMRPALVICKASSTSSSWNMFDSTRASYNVVQAGLLADEANAEFTGTDRIDILSNGFKVRSGTAEPNASGVTYVYMAWAEHPFATARAR